MKSKLKLNSSQQIGAGDELGNIPMHGCLEISYIYTLINFENNREEIVPSKLQRNLQLLTKTTLFIGHFTPEIVSNIPPAPEIGCKTQYNFGIFNSETEHIIFELARLKAT